MRSWATEELKYAALPDKRLNQRLIKIVENLAQQPHASVPQASGDWANTKATYNFWKSNKIELEDIIDPHQQQTAQRASKEKIILAIQDTSDFNFTHHQAKTWDSGFGMTCSQKYVKEAMGQIPNAGRIKISVPRQDETKSRTAELTIRYASFEFPPPINRANSFQHRSVTLNVISAIEENPPSGVTPIQWLLLTTLEVNNFDEAICRIRWYTYRWLIERYHYVLKSGCRIEQLQLKNAERIKKALATYTIVAWRLLWLTYQARENPNLPCDTILEQYEWQSLYCHFQGFPLSLKPPSMKQAVIWIAQLGGFLARQHDGFPGVKTIWRGLQRLHDIASTWKLLHSSSNQNL